MMKPKTFLIVSLSAVVIAAAIVALPVFYSEAADASGRVDTRVLEGQKNKTQDMFTRQTEPVFSVNSLLYIVTNKSDGVIFLKTNATVLQVVGLPNPTNNIGRRFEITTLGAGTARLTNYTYAGTFFDMLTMSNSAVGFFMESNKTAVVYSTGTNYYVRLH